MPHRIPEQLPLLPSQAWFLEEIAPTMLNPNNWCFLATFQLPGKVDAEMCHAAAQALWRHHDALRVRIVDTPDGPRQAVRDAQLSPPFRSIDMSRVPRDEVPAAVRAVAGDTARTVNLATGPLARFTHLRTPEGSPSQLIVAVHHLVTDDRSHQVLESDLEATFRALLAGQAVRLRPSAPYRDCVRAIVDYARSDELGRELERWQSHRWDDVADLPADAPDHTGDAVRRWETVVSTVDGDDLVALCRNVTPKLSLSLESVLLAAVVEALTEWSGGALAVRLLDNGRNLRRGGTGHPAAAAAGHRVLPAAAWRTVGWFTTGAVVLLPPRRTGSVSDYLRTTAARMALMPNRGVGLNLLRWAATPATRETARQPWSRCQVLFNYWRALPPAAAGRGLLAPGEPPPQLLDITEAHLPLHVNAIVGQNEISVRWDHDPTVRRVETIRAVAQRFRSIVATYAGLDGP